MLQQYEISDIAVSLRDIASKLDTVNLDALDFTDKERVVSQLSASLYGSNIAEALAEEFPYTVATRLAAYAPEMVRDALKDADELSSFDKDDVRWVLDKIISVIEAIKQLRYLYLQDVPDEADELSRQLASLVAELENTLDL
jgi:hypothetical protein